jgi:hypothetical protein
MDMHSADLVARADHLQIAHDPVMARRRRDVLVQPVGAGMGPEAIRSMPFSLAMAERRWRRSASAVRASPISTQGRVATSSWHCSISRCSSPGYSARTAAMKCGDTLLTDECITGSCFSSSETKYSFQCRIDIS